NLVQQGDRVLVVPDLQALPANLPMALFGPLGLRTLLAANLLYNGRLVGVMVVMTQAAPRQFTESELALLKGLADQAALAIGYTRDELIGSSVDLLNVKQGTPADFARVLKELRADRTPRLAEAAHVHRDGHTFPIEYSTVLINLGGRELVLGIDRDITERKR